MAGAPRENSATNDEGRAIRSFHYWCAALPVHLGLEVPVHNPGEMTLRHDAQDLPDKTGRRGLRVVTVLHDVVEELTTGA